MVFSEFLKINGVTFKYDIHKSRFIYRGMEPLLKKTVWITDYRLNLLRPAQKPIRNIAPCEVGIFADPIPEQAGTFQRPYLRKLKQNGDFVKTIIDPVDNTCDYGEVQVFPTKAEADDCFLKMLDKAQAQLNDYVENIVGERMSQISEHRSKINK